MPKATSNKDLSTFKADILLLSGGGMKVRIFNKKTKDWVIAWLPRCGVVVDGNDEIKMSYKLAFDKDLI